MRVRRTARTVARAASMTAVVLPLVSGCALVYLPSQEALKAKDVGDADQLRRQLVVFVEACDEKQATGTVRNRSTSDANATVTVSFLGEAGPTTASATVDVPRNGAAAWTVAPPAGGDASRGCQPELSAVSLR